MFGIVAAVVVVGLIALFALRGRVRPWSKYLRWELESEPISPEAQWQAVALLDRLDASHRA